MFIRRLSIVSACVCVLAWPFSLRAEELAITTDAHQPPLDMNEGDQVVGIASETLIKALAQAGISYRISVYPWLRAYGMALHDQDTCVFSTFRTEEREPLFKWVGPLAQDEWAIYARADQPARIRSIDDLKPFKVGGINGDAESYFLRSQGIAVDELDVVAADVYNIKKLLNGRIDFWAASRLYGSYLASHNGRPNIKLVLRIRQVGLYLACNKTVSDALVDRLNDEIRTLESDGLAGILAKKYLGSTVP